VTTGQAGANHMDCRALLKWALPHIGLAWPGFSRVHRQVCKRIGRRVGALGLADMAAYRNHLDQHEDEWPTFDAFCRISISRLCRDSAVFVQLGRDVLPVLATATEHRGEQLLRVWSAGCASGEEPFSVNMLWQLKVAPHHPGLAMSITATDTDAVLLQRARAATYTAGGVREVPETWRDVAFERDGSRFRVKPQFRNGITFIEQDVRRTAPAGPFDLILCRNLAFTYFGPDQQEATAQRLLRELRTGGALLIGARENLPAGIRGVTTWDSIPGVYRKLSHA
jgi:chemotaxis protein methyltransferase CheR